MPVPNGINMNGSSMYVGSGFLNSGFIVPSQSFSVTFVKAGDYQYSSLLHDMMGMVGSVHVLPQAGSIQSTWDLTPSVHAGSVPSAQSGSNATGGSNASSSGSMPGMS